ncbi:MAG: hypothetical protein ACM3N7_09185 [Planctomycetaceae bacterium]
MNRMIYPVGLFLLTGILLLPMEGNAQMGPWMMGPGYDPGYSGAPGGYGYGYCPYGGPHMGYGGGYGRGPRMMGPGYGMGPWMMGPGWGYPMGPGMMGWGYGMGPWMMGPGYYGAQQGPQKPLDEKGVKSMLENYLQSMGNPNLKLGKITEKGANFEAQIVTKDNSLADKVLVDKNTGWIRSAY